MSERASAQAGGGCLGVVPVALGDRRAPGGTPALRELRGVPLLRRAVSVLIRSDCVEHVVVAAPAALVPMITDLLSTVPAGGIHIEVAGVPGPGPGHRLRAALLAHSAPSAPALVVVHDPLHALASAALVRSVVQAMSEAGPAITSAVPVRMVTDTLKWVNDDDVVESTADRDDFRMVYSPQVHRYAALVAALAGASAQQLADGGSAALPQLMHTAGGRVISVPAPAEVFRLGSDEDIQLAEAMLHVGAANSDGD